MLSTLNWVRIDLRLDGMGVSYSQADVDSCGTYCVEDCNCWMIGVCLGDFCREFFVGWSEENWGEIFGRRLGDRWGILG